MQSFAYANPATIQEAVALLSAKWGEADVLAGGTDLISLMKENLHTPKRVVNIKNIKELETIQKTGAGIRIGALVTMDELAGNNVIKAAAKALSDAAAAISSPQIRHMATVGGNLCQRPRCWYYRQGFGLFAMKDGKSMIPDGANQYHAIFGGGPAYFVSPSSLGPALVALGARIKLVSAKGPREVPAASFFVVPQDETSREIALHPDEILTEILIPAGAVLSATYEVRQKEALDWPLATASVVLHMRGNVVASAKVVMGYVAPKPWDSPEAAQAIAGKPITAETAEAAGKAAVSGAQPLSQNAYKVTLARVAVKRALLEAAKQKA
jgi:xanthine dehydrogenase YagS FAD-binding subunit